MIDKFFENIAKVLGSTPVIALSIAWCIKAYIDGNQQFIDVISMVTFVFGEFILRGQSSQTDRMEKNVKRDVKLTKKILKEVEDVGFKV